MRKYLSTATIATIALFSYFNHAAVAQDKLVDENNAQNLTGQNFAAPENITKNEAQTDTQPVAKIPSSIFARYDGISGPILSPNQESVAYIERVNGKLFIAAHNFKTNHLQYISAGEHGDLRWYRWAGDDYIIFSIGDIVDFNREERLLTSLYKYNIKTKEFSVVGLKQKVLIADDVLYIDPKGQYLLQQIRRSYYDYPSVFRVDIATNETKEIIKQKADIWDWYADNTGVVRLGIGIKGDTDNFGGVSYIARDLVNRYLFYYRSNENEGFKQVSKVSLKGDPDKVFASFAAVSNIVSGSDEFFVRFKQENGNHGVRKFNYLTQEWGDIIYQNPDHDISDIILTDDGRDILAATYFDNVGKIIWFDKKMAKMQDDLQITLPNQLVEIRTSNYSKDKYIVSTSSDKDPGSYYLFDPNNKGLHRFNGVNDRIDPAKMSDRQYVSYTARDGVKISAYLTLPKGKPAKNLPLIIYPHGGPFFVHDSWEFDSDAQFLANRGYAVLQPNFRGSGGYGNAFYELGHGQIGLKMQDDLDDGMDFLVKQGIADANRACIVGASYGGYAALWGATRNPERYRCAASFAGVTDWDLMLLYDNDFLDDPAYKRFSSALKGEDRAKLKYVSPLLNIDKLTRPILLAQGKKDDIVPFSQHRAMVKAAKAAGVNFEELVFEEEAHGFKESKNHQKWLDTLEAFLNKHNPADE
ncbi:hypothetical protein LPB140_11675 [Sphingorhabdus lutea]|uniref:Peptidase S9 prolyl oligopeptidase catalytic domain-containing protein n=1 Tax=Sphingorhabdus lutea TaxID=1913578 RepID=A0A1L3JDX0_9SPHN|nr:S9 family peptidase [Sphingorhabdus lutea]APG63337.1 hypothetical protein LPB140_11675 [Sphingorhabdus lutea]